MAGLIKYRGREGQLSFILHRLTGLGILGFLVVHVLDTSTVFFFPSHYEHAIAIYRSVPFMISEVFLVFSVIYHGVNGARIAIFDLYLLKNWRPKSERNSALWTLVIAILMWLPAAFIMGRTVLQKLGI
jgi:succinate dehydrogenase / fumarate reductase cytochrome b subunit